MSQQKPQYWESPEEIRLIQKRKEIRQRLQNEFNRIYYNPYRHRDHIELMDPSVSRYSAMRASIYEHWRPNWKGFWRWMSITYIPIIYFAWSLRQNIREVDADCRTGKIPYEKREFRRI